LAQKNPRAIGSELLVWDVHDRSSPQPWSAYGVMSAALMGLLSFAIKLELGTLAFFDLQSGKSR